MWKRSRVAQLLVAFDWRRNEWQVKPLGCGVALLTTVVTLILGLALWGNLSNRIWLIDVKPTTRPPEAPDTSSRPLEWPVWETRGAGGQPMYQVPEEVQEMIMADVSQSMQWWANNLTDLDELEVELPLYFGGAELARRQQSIGDMRRFGKAGVVYSAKGESGLQFRSTDETGITAQVLYSLAARQVAFYRLDDGALVEGSPTILPPVSIDYRLVFDPGRRRWLVEEQMGVMAQP